MPQQLFLATERGVKNLGWLKSNFSFSFSSYQNPLRNGFGLLKVFNDDFVQPGGGFGLHPHQNMEIISIMLAGKMNHKDTMGYSEVVEKDWVQIMSAGSGLRHEEHNVGTEEVRFLQIWIEPKLQNISPRYQKRFFPEENRKNQLVTIVSNQEGAQHCWINQNAQISMGYFAAKTTTNYLLNATNKAVFVFCVSGKMTVNGIELTETDALGLWETENVAIENLDESRFVIIETPINA
jgi:quercetin 2,3-dioxygenase